MDLQYFFNILWRRKWLILVVALTASITTYYFVDKQTDLYKANGVMTTRIVGERGIDMRESKPWIMEFYVKMGFENMINAMTSHRNLNFLTSRLLLHDFRSTDTTLVINKPFRSLEGLKGENLEISDEDISRLMDTLEYKVQNLSYNFTDPAQEKLFNQLAVIMGYDDKSLMKNNLSVARNGDTDNLNIDFISDNPHLSTFAVNTFAEDYLRVHNETKQAEGGSSVNFLKGEVNNAKSKLLALESQVNNYKSNKSLYDAGDESQGIITRRNDVRKALETERAKVPALKANIAELERLIREKEGSTNNIERSNIENNAAVINMRKELSAIDRDLLIEGNSEERAKLNTRRELIKKNLDDKISKLADDYKLQGDLPEDKRSISKLFDKKVQATLDLNEANQRILTLEKELKEVASKQVSLVQNDAVVQNLESEITIARKEYEMLQERLAEAKLNLKDTYQPLKILEYARTPEGPESKNKEILTVFAGIVGAVLSTVFIFFMAFLDTSVNSVNKFRKFANVPLLGTVNKIKTNDLDLKYLFSTNGQDPKLDNFKESLRNIRYQIENTNATRFLFTSTKNQEGKTFMIVTLAHALMIKDKKILIVDTNFKNNSLTQMSNQSIEENNLISTNNNNKLIGENDLDTEFVSQKIANPFNLENVDIIGNKGSFQSPSEVFAKKDFDKFLSELESHYDYIFFEGAPVNKYSDTKELEKYVEKVIAVFGAESEIRALDKDSITYLKGLGDKFMGAILNKVDLKNL